MQQPFGRLKPVCIAAFVVSGLAGPSFANVYSCVFISHCTDADQPCTPTKPLAMKLIRKGDVWVLHDPDGAMTNFAPVANDAKGVHTLLATNPAPDASATSILSLFDDGQALLTSHGDFGAAAAVTQVGTCQLEADL